MRLALALSAGAATAALGALILGEYELVGWTPYVAGVLFGIAVAEVVVTLARRRDVAVALPAAALSGAGMVWAAWISSGRDWGYVTTGAWVGVALATAGAGLWVAKLR